MPTSIVDLICLQTANLTLLKLRCSKFAIPVPLCNSCLVQVKGGKKKEAEIKCALEACRWGVLAYIIFDH